MKQLLTDTLNVKLRYEAIITSIMENENKGYPLNVIDIIASTKASTYIEVSKRTYSPIIRKSPNKRAISSRSISQTLSLDPPKQPTQKHQTSKTLNCFTNKSLKMVSCGTKKQSKLDEKQAKYDQRKPKTLNEAF